MAKTRQEAARITREKVSLFGQRKTIRDWAVLAEALDSTNTPDCFGPPDNLNETDERVEARNAGQNSPAESDHRILIYPNAVCRLGWTFPATTAWLRPIAGAGKIPGVRPEETTGVVQPYPIV